MTLVYGRLPALQALALIVDRVGTEAGVLVFESLKKSRSAVREFFAACLSSLPCSTHSTWCMDSCSARSTRSRPPHPALAVVTDAGWGPVHAVMRAAGLDDTVSEGPPSQYPTQLVQKWFGALPPFMPTPWH
jgi:hypothetical protein